MAPRDAPAIRRMLESETDQVAAVWHRSGRQAYPYLPAWQAMTLATALDVFANHIAPRCDVWLVEEGGRIAGFLAMQGSYVDRLYVEPARQRRGLGAALVAHAKQLSPCGLELHTHQQNRTGRAFYESLGFAAVRYGVSPPPENAPDVEYHWRPARARADDAPPGDGDTRPT